MSQLVSRCFRSISLPTILTAVALSSGAVLAQDVTRPKPVDTLMVDKGAGGVHLSWDAVLEDVSGEMESIDHYNVYRGTTPDFVPDKVAFSNRIGTPSSLFFDDDVLNDGIDYYYLVSAVDQSGNESDTLAPLVTTLPTLTGFWTDSTIEVDWTDAGPAGTVVAYYVYYGTVSGRYEFVEDVGLSTSHSLTGLQTNRNWYIAVTAVDANGNETAFSNEHIDAVRGTIRFRALDAEELCWGGGCSTTDPNSIHRNSGFQVLTPVHFPEGEWVSATVTFIMESRLCVPPNQGTVSKCGDGNPCPEPPCNGGYNPCGDPWDRIAKLFLVLDDCVEAGGSCVTQNNLELMRAVTPFGTDATPPDGSGVVPPRKLTLDITPFVPLLTGEKWIGAEIVHYVQAGWWVTVDFAFSERPADASPKPPADGIEIYGYGNAPLPTKEVTIPASATEVKARIFTTGHGGSLFCDGGVNDAEACTVNGSDVECPGGVCYPCDEFCHRTNSLLANSTPIWEVVPFRTDCSPGPACSAWNACGFPSCTYPRAGWCPGYIACHENAPCDNDIDLTTELPPGGTYDLDYTITPQNGSWPISVVLFWYE